MVLSLQEYRNSVMGCWMGKNIGGTLGAPMEWHRKVNDVSFYQQELDGNPLPNDDLDIQLLWLVALEEQGVHINARTMGDYWMNYVTPHWAEYGNAKANMKAGMPPPLSGTANNPFKDSCGCYIRSEIWACIAPGSPHRAARFAYEDAIIDHGNGEGVYGEIFCAALESAAFVEKDINNLIDIGLSYIPKDCDVAKAIKLVRKLHKKGKPWLETRDEIIRNFCGGFHFSVSEDDIKKGFGEGKVGWEVPSNVAIVVLGLLYGEGDFSKTLCITVNCGEDTDCTAATVGAMLGIIQGYGQLPEEWIKPIGSSIKTLCLNLGEIGWAIPQDINNLSQRVEKIANQVIAGHKLQVQLSPDQPANYKTSMKSDLHADDKTKAIYNYSNGTLHSFDFFDIYVDYGAEGAVISKDGSKKIRLVLRNTYRIPEMLRISWYLADGFQVTPASTLWVHVPHDYTHFMPTEYFNGTKEVEFELKTNTAAQAANRFVIEVIIEGKASVMLVPVVLLSEVR
ncbi:MAG: ADP-ribosylglycohydrolase family protein [Defluviitaleaceae bacterium]|nr:ADP-ribosylglycohydrolase family protein [Defluviitaleaceae bacterium]